MTHSSPPPLVSIVMPAWKPDYLERALESVWAQTYPAIELIVCDDSGAEGIESAVRGMGRVAPFHVRYVRNPGRLGEAGSTMAGVVRSGGEYIKFLHDDDVLAPDCIARLVAAMERAPQAAMASSRRLRIDGRGRPLPDILATRFPFAGDVLVDGRGLVSFLADHTLNFIGEPSCVLCRRQDLLQLDDGLMSLAGRPIRWVGDLALYAKLLQRGPLALLAAPLAKFRVSAHQFSQDGRDAPGIGEQGHADFRQAVRALGWYHGEDGGPVRHVPVAPLDAPHAMQPVDLLQLLEQAHAGAVASWKLHQWQASRQLPPAQAALLEQRLAGQAQAPRLGIVVQDQGRSAQALQRTLASIAESAGRLGSVLALSVRSPQSPAATAVAAAPVDWAVHPCADASITLEQAARDWDVDWLLAVEAGAEFSIGGLLRLHLELAGAGPGTHALYADEWYRAEDGTLAPVMRPDFNLDLLLGNPAMMAGHWLFRREALSAAGGFAAEAAGAAELDLILRLVQHSGLGGITHLPEPLLTCAPPTVDAPAQRTALLRHLHARGYAHAHVADAGPGLYRIDYGHDRQPPVSLVVVVPADLALATLERCVVSILEQTRYQNYELLLIDNGASSEAGQWIAKVETLAAGKVRAFRLDPPLAHAAACNVAAGQAGGEFLLFLRAEVAAVQPQWLDELLNHGLRPEVGVVGAKTVSADGRITHAGLVPGLLASGGRAFAGLTMDAPGYMNRLQVAHDCSAVSDACLMVRRDLFVELDGFDHAAFADEGADVDLCLRIAARGGLTVCTPQALLLHPVQAGPLPEAAQDALLERWLPQIAHDPAYNPSLRLDLAGGFRLGESDFSWRPLPAGTLPRILAQPADPWGSGQYRVIQPFQALREAGLAEGALYATLLDPVQLARIDPDVVVMQRRVSEADIAAMRRMRRFSRAFAVYELDDWLPNLPLKNAHRATMPADIVRGLRGALAQVDRMVVATPALAEAFAGYHARIRVVQNRLDPGLWSQLPVVPARPAGQRPRVGWAGGLSHDGDLELIADVVRELAGEVDWVFFGLCPEKLRPYVKEFHPGIDFHAYPRALALLGLDLALAPLEDNAFNRCKSQLRLLEYGACGYPVVCSDLAPYQGDLPVTRVRNRFRDWVGAIRQHLAEPEASAAAGQALKQAVLGEWMLEGAALEEWRRAWLPD